MKRIILFISVIGLFSLVSCGSKNIDNESSNSNQIIDNSNQNEPSDNISSSENDNSLSSPSESKDENNDSSTTPEESTEGGSVYDDGIDWGPLH